MNFLDYRSGNTIVVRSLFDSLSQNINKLCAIKSSGSQDYNDYKDISQQVLLKIHQFRNDYDKNKSFKSWIYTITINTMTDEYRKKKSYSFLTNLIDSYRNEDENDIDILDNISDEKQLLEEVSENKNFIAYVTTKLNKEEIILLTLYAVEEFSMEEISDILNLKISNTKVKIHRLIKKIREEYGHHWTN